MAAPRAADGGAPVQPRLPAAAGRGVRRRADGAARPSQRAAAVYRAVGMAAADRCATRSTASSPTGCWRRCGARRCGWSTTTSPPSTEIDDAIRLGAGLRWAFMGTFLTYRIAGGEAGMRHFMAQFGPALKWPWTKLMDVPELDRRAARQARRAVRRPGGRAIGPRAGAAPRRLPGRGAAGPARARCGRRRGARRYEQRCSTAGGTGERRRNRRRRAAAAAPRPGAARVDRLQRPRPREPLPAGVRRRHGRPAAAGRRRRGVPGRSTAATSRSRRTSRHLAPGARRRAAADATPGARPPTTSACTCSTRSSAPTTASCSRPPSRCCCTSRPATAGPGPPPTRCGQRSGRSPTRTRRCRP